MKKIQAIDKDTIEVKCEDKTVRIVKGDKIVFTQSYKIFEHGDTRVVEPIKDMGEIQLLCREDNKRFSKAMIEEIICKNIIKIIE